MKLEDNIDRIIAGDNCVNLFYSNTPVGIKNINSRITGAQGYFGDRTILPLLENIFKIKIVVIDSFEEQIHNGSFVKFLDSGNNVFSGFVKEINFSTGKKVKGSASVIKISKGAFEASAFEKNFELMRQKIVLGLLKEALVGRFTELGEMLRLPSNGKSLMDQYSKLINSLDALLNILETMKCPFFYNISDAAADAKLSEFNDKMSEIFEQPNIIKYLETPTKTLTTAIFETPLINLSIYFNGTTSDKGFLTYVTDFYPTFIIKTQDSNEFQMSCQRLIPSEQNFFVSQQLNPLGNSLQIDDFMFLLCDNISETYSNIFSFTENRFVYDYREIPPFYNMLIFNSLVKFSKATDVANIQKLPFFRYINPEYIQTMVDYKTKIDEDSSDTTTMTPIELKDSAVPTAVRRGTRIRKQTPAHHSTRGGASLSSGYVSANRGNTSYASNRDSRLSYYVIIDLDLYPGKDGIPLAQKAVLACQNRYEKIRQAWAKLFGLVYRPNELYVTGFTAPSALKKRGDQGEYRRSERSGDNYRSTRRRRDREREDERRPRNRTERSGDRDRYREREREG
jgi:hypothetical protein